MLAQHLIDKTIPIYTFFSVNTHLLLLYSQTDVHQLIQLRAAALIHVSAACMALVHQGSKQLYRFSRFRVTHTLKLLHPCSFPVHVLGSLVRLKMCYCERGEDVTYGNRCQVNVTLHTLQNLQLIDKDLLLVVLPYRVGC